MAWADPSCMYLEGHYIQTLTMEGETKYQLKRTFLWSYHQTSFKLRLPNFLSLILHELHESDSPGMTSHRFAKIHRASRGPGKLKASLTQAEPSRHI